MTKNKAMNKKKRGPRGPYRCARCREFGHRANDCPNQHKFQRLLDALPGEITMRSLIPEAFQIMAIVEGQVSEALLGAIKGNQLLAERGIPHSQSLVNAWSELAERAAKISPDVLTKARAARRAYLEAEARYAEATAPIAELLGHKRK